jgi:hypothetical protein
MSVTPAHICVILLKEMPEKLLISCGIIDRKTKLLQMITFKVRIPVLIARLY